MAEKTPPPPVGSLTDSEGGEGRHLVQWLRGSLSAERGAKKAAQRSVSSLEARIASLERQLQNQRPAKSRLRKSSSGEPENPRPGADGSKPRGDEGANQQPSIAQYERRSPQRSPGRSKRTGELEGVSVEAAAWNAWQTFASEMARIADAREARQSALERKVDSLAQRFESFSPHAAAGARASSSGPWEPASVPRDYHDVPGTSRALGEPASIPPDYHDVPGTSKSSEEEALSERWKLSIPAPMSERYFQQKESESRPKPVPNVDSLAIWGGFSNVDSRPLKDVDSNGARAATHLRTSSEGDAQLLTTTGRSPENLIGEAAARLREMTSSENLLVTSVEAADESRPKDYISTAESNTEADYPDREGLTLDDVREIVSAEAAGERTGGTNGTQFGMQHSVLYSPLGDDTIWQSIIGGSLEEDVGVKDVRELEVADQSVAQTLAKMRGHLDRRMLGFDRSGGEAAFEPGAGFDDGSRVEMRPSRMPYVTLPATPLHEGTPLWSQLSRSTSGGSLDFQ